MRKRRFGKTCEGRDGAVFTLVNANGVEIAITNYGGIAVPLEVPDRLGKGGAAHGRRTGLQLETQHFPDSPYQSTLPSTVLKAGESYESTTLFTFSNR